MTSTDPVWEQIFRQQAWGKYPSEHVIRFVARNFYRASDRAKVRLLDLGSGPGASAWFMAREGFAVTAIDSAATAIDQLKARFASEGLSIDAQVGDATKLPFADASFDAVVDNFCLCHMVVSATEHALGEVRRVLKPGGRVLSTSFSDRTHGYGFGREVEPGAFSDISEGPLEGRGLVAFRSRADIDRLYRKFAPLEIERLSWTLEGMRQSVETWIVTGTKPS